MAKSTQTFEWEINVWLLSFSLRWHWHFSRYYDTNMVPQSAARHAVIELDIDDHQAVLEALGTKRKFWFRRNDEPEKTFLFKEGRPNTGENWAEVLAADICSSLLIPHAEYQLGKWKDHCGVISPNLVPEKGRLIHGNEMLARMIHGYEGTRTYQARQHTIRSVMAVLGQRDVVVPENFSGLEKASEVFLGYLMLDALIGNTDRHHENWGLISNGDVVSLSPTYDHASSLGRNESDERRNMRLTTRDSRQSVGSYAEKARSGFYSSDKSQSKTLLTLDAFVEGAKLMPNATQFWLNHLERLDVEEIDAIISRVPSEIMSSAAANFAREMLVFNRLRLLRCMN